jgi:HEAT repeat protein
MNTKIKFLLTALALALAFAASVQAAGPGDNERELVAMAEGAELAEIAAVLTDPDAPERFAAVNALFNIASRHPVVPMEISDLLEAAAHDPDPDIARFASSALYQVEMWARWLAEQPPETRSEAELRENVKQRELEEIGMILNDPRSPERYAAANALSNLASTYNVLPGDVLDLLQRIRGDDDFEIARLAETELARREGRPIDPSFAREPVAPNDQPAEQKRHDDPFENISDPDPNMRYDALAYLLEIAPKDGKSIDPEVLKAFTEAISDPDPRVRSYAEFAIGGGLAGDENALRQVFIGTVQGDAGDSYELQPISSEAQKGAAQPEDELDQHGVFIGVTNAPPGESQDRQEQAHENLEAKQHVGAFDEHGVFIGVVVPPIGSEGQTEAVTVDFTSN